MLCRPDPDLRFHGNFIVSNDDWQTATNADQIPINLQPSDSRDQRFWPLYRRYFTAILRGKNGAGGVAN
jgi:hypothetical protein